MITRRTKVQLLVFALITLVGVSFVGARYARLDRLVERRDMQVEERRREVTHSGDGMQTDVFRPVDVRIEVAL